MSTESTLIEMLEEESENGHDDVDDVERGAP